MLTATMPMKKENRRLFREIGYASCLGISMAIAIFAGLFIGVYCDKKLGTDNIFVIVFLVFGIAAAYRNVQVFIKRYIKDAGGRAGDKNGESGSKNDTSEED